MSFRLFLKLFFYALLGYVTLDPSVVLAEQLASCTTEYIVNTTTDD